jgi:hypothetical protein
MAGVCLLLLLLQMLSQGVKSLRSEGAHFLISLGRFFVRMGTIRFLVPTGKRCVSLAKSFTESLIRLPKLKDNFQLLRQDVFDWAHKAPATLLIC